MFSDSIKYLFLAFKRKKIFFLSRITTTYDAVTGTVTEVEVEVPIQLIELSLDIDNLPKGCLSTDRKFAILIDHIDKSDKLEDLTGLEYIINYVKQTSFSPSVYEVIIRGN